ncbi:hypothetical protein [Arthrobacter sp. UYEF3]|uniref:hypothetical protein n=1 Tax=Arthrobacter sp. UYEF3 TaxID=1756365 RepID=UPI0033994D1F
MEQHQEFTDLQQPALRQTALQHAAVQHWEVTYLDTECDRVRTEAFEDADQAERFAGRQVRDESGWAMIDAVRPRRDRAAA